MENKDSKEFLQQKEILTQLFKKVTELQYKEFKAYLRNIKQKIEEHKVQNISSIESLINDSTEGKGKTILHFAAAKGDLKVFKLLIKNGGSLTKRDDEDNTPFFTALTHAQLDIIKYLIENKLVDVNEVRKGNVIALHLAVSYGNLDIIKYLVEKGADVNKVSEYGSTITWASVYRTPNQLEIIKYLIQSGANVNGSPESCVPAPLILAIDQNNKELFDVLIENNADVNAKDDQQYSVLHLCAEKGSIHMLQTLLAKGANPNYEKDGKTPLFYAFERERIDVVTILRQYTKKPIDEDQLKKQIDSNKNSSQTTQSNMQAHPEEQLTEQQKQANIKSAEEVKAQGNTLFQSGKYEEALATYNQAYKLNSQNVQIITNIAACQNKLKLYKEAIETCKLARQIDKSWTKLYYREGEAYYNLEEYIDSASAYWEGWQLTKDDPQLKSLFLQAVQMGKQKEWFRKKII